MYIYVYVRVLADIPNTCTQLNLNGPWTCTRAYRTAGIFYGPIFAIFEENRLTVKINLLHVNNLRYPMDMIARVIKN